jgi:hypothetical protein
MKLKKCTRCILSLEKNAYLNLKEQKDNWFKTLALKFNGIKDLSV